MVTWVWEECFGGDAREIADIARVDCVDIDLEFSFYGEKSEGRIDRQAVFSKLKY